ncbi:DUF4431 domain-containing protein [Aquabacterium sp.]|uniref:DUF4431 domain-containing protein n=1 Tax=Aquabacterium sp. TaxID=1872578 RepID=UPI0019ADF3DE|nr:DUF4431 domain-containing protein [Aquabacterium sp.]MBC7702058.1 DUF4431 domain-containing protein [Aquabacterium sp.]
MLTTRCAAVMGALLVCGSPASTWARKVCHEAHEQVSLTGRLAHQTFAGPPNYESVRRGDAREVMPVLHLTRALCVRAPGVDDHRLRNRDIKTVQLLDTDDLVPSAAKHAYRVRGRLMFAESGHHHVPVLLEVDRIEDLAGQH